MIQTFATRLSTVYTDYLWNTSVPQVIKEIAPEMKRVCCSPMAPNYMDWSVQGTTHPVGATWDLNYKLTRISPRSSTKRWSSRDPMYPVRMLP